jgi:hypothetical protein
MFECFMLPLEFRELCFDCHIVHLCFSSDANAFRTSDKGIPNSRAILDGVMPALNADRTALTLPRVKGASAIPSRCRFSAGSDFVRSLCGALPRRFISSSVASCIKSNSSLLKCLRALGKFLGRTYRCGLSLAVVAAGDVEAVPFGSGSGTISLAGSGPMGVSMPPAESVGNQYVASQTEFVVRQDLGLPPQSLLALHTLVLSVGVRAGSTAQWINAECDVLGTVPIRSLELIKPSPNNPCRRMSG